MSLHLKLWLSLSLVYLLSIGCWVIFLAIDWERAITIYNQRLSSPPLGLVLLLGSCIHKVTLTQSCCLDCIGIGLTKHRYCSTSTFVQLKVMLCICVSTSLPQDGYWYTLSPQSEYLCLSNWWYYNWCSIYFYKSLSVY